MNKGLQLFWGIATIVGVIVIALWFLGRLQRLLFWLRFQLVPGLTLLAIVVGIIYLGWVIFFKEER
ncbi:MAG: hypothetical protein RMK91_00275 [Pseudanabaenaceae cyanobacterium SKYGB_i_bin29]|nr:hypothetical protein [Pseudanabaenaceae cyanobacterium SKYG29]MDW8420288.1 hypothetical protein [Pseudanabaenaceae cyanobacterium SKYGB_i_bin29]